MHSTPVATTISTQDNLAPIRRSGRGGGMSFPGFDGIRLVAAWSVVLTHSYLLAGGADAHDPLLPLLGRAFGDYAVQVFFILSGFLLSGTLDTNPDPLRYLTSRLLRIVPGFGFALAVSVLVIAPVLSAPGWHLIATREAWLSIYWSLTTLRDVITFQMDGVRHVEFASALNASLWSIAYEVICYLVLLWLYLVFRKASRVAAAACGLAVVVVAGRWLGVATSNWDEAGPGVLRLPYAFFDGTLPFFCCGAAYYAVHKRWGTPVWLVLASAVVLVLAAVLGLAEMALAWTGPALIVWLGSRPGVLRPLIGRVGDISYGVYLFGWPVGLLMSAIVPGAGALAVFALSVPLVGFFAYAMHRLVERPIANIVKPRVLRWLPSFRLGRPGRPHGSGSDPMPASAPVAVRTVVYVGCLVAIVRLLAFPYPFGIDWFSSQLATLVEVCVSMALLLKLGVMWTRRAHRA